MINLNLDFVAIVKEVVKKLEEKEKLKLEKLEEIDLQYVLKQNKKEEEKWSKMWD